MAEDNLLELIGVLSQIADDDSIPKNIRLKVNRAIEALQENEKDMKIKANKALQELDDISDDPNVPSYIRPQIWNVASSLESV